MGENLTHICVYCAFLCLYYLLPLEVCCSLRIGIKSGGERSSNILLALITVKVLLIALAEHGLRHDDVTEDDVSKWEVMRRSAVELVAVELSFTKETRTRLLNLNQKFVFN